MLVRRHLYPPDKLPMPKVRDNGMEVEPIYNEAQKKASNSIVRDVEDLLKPIRRQQHNDEISEQQSQFSKERTERNLWRNNEVMEMLYAMQQVKALEKLNDKTVKSEHVFRDVEAIMHKNGFFKKSHVQIWTKWKFLKSTYMTSKRNGVIPRIIPTQIYEIIHQMITTLNQNLADAFSSVDSDSCSGMRINSVEGGVSDVSVANENDDDSFGVAHPIFGFRLGMVKSEPEDIGYEPVDNNDSDRDPLEEELATSKPQKSVKEEHNTNEVKSISAVVPPQKAVEVPHRGRGRPPKYPPAATSTPNNTPATATLPPLRVAPFARTSHTANSLAVTRPPPPLTMPPSPRNRVTNLANIKNGDPPKFAQPKLIPKPTPQHSPPTQSLRISKETNAQTRSSSTPSPSYPKMKQIPMRKTPYSLRPDRAIPDLEASLSPPSSPIEKLSSKKLEEVPTTKHLIMQSNSYNLHNISNKRSRIDPQDPINVRGSTYFNDTMEEEMDSSKTESSDYDKNYGKILQNVIIDLSSSLRKMQTEMMRDFFNKQNELLEREHHFQMQQDQMIMKAFQEQTQEIMHSVKQLVSNIKTHQHKLEHHIEERKCKPNRKRRMQQMHRVVQEDEMANSNDNIDESDTKVKEIESYEQQQPNQIEERTESGQDEMEANDNTEENEGNNHQAEKELMIKREQGNIQNHISFDNNRNSMLNICNDLTED